jgi:AcrR family transcriptional regulator
MSRPKPDYQEREERILDAAIGLILRQGYNKTTLGDVAAEASVSRGVVYLHFKSKDRLFEALLYREVQKYNRIWLDALGTDPDGGTIAGVFRAVLSAVNQLPFISALLKQDRRVFGNYLRKPGNLFESIQSAVLWVELLKELQGVRAVRADIQPSVFAHIMTSLALGLILSEGDKNFGNPPPFEDTLETIALMIERTLTPEGGGNPAAERAIILRLAQVSQAQFERSRSDTTAGRRLQS